jgi:hypothetical protein
MIGLCLKSRTLGLDTVSTGSGSDLVSDQRAIFPKSLDSDRLTRSLQKAFEQSTNCRWWDLSFFSHLWKSALPQKSDVGLGHSQYRER